MYDYVLCTTLHFHAESDKPVSCFQRNQHFSHKLKLRIKEANTDMEIITFSKGNINFIHDISVPKYMSPNCIQNQETFSKTN